ncbi:hypothetical protein ACIGZI_32235 [Streptomyces griseus]|uniref:hypothetical protein n=1 Tax=Streptomyces griseus TaxID=1911 RepID=UPI0037CF164F
MTDPNPPGLAPDDLPATAGFGPSAPSTRQARLSMTRWLLSPRTMWHARCLTAADPRLNKQAAWMVARLARHPDEHAYMIAMMPLGAVAFLMSGNAVFGTMLAVVTVLLLAIWLPVPRVLVRWIRAGKDKKTT